jgi:endonuclease YncB( thermonuclease family)
MTPDDDTLTVLVTNFELLRVLDGNELTFATTGGTPVKIRLTGVDELLASHREACEAIGMEPSMTRNEAIALSMPVGRALLGRQP